jgi:cell wall-associated NlpC family hydrolase
MKLISKALISKSLPLLCCVLLASCAATPTPQLAQPSPGTTLVQPPPSSAHPASQPLQIATDLLGTPYRYGGNTPAGFDCSGLVYYAFTQSGRDVPRSSLEQFQRSQRIAPADLQAGDLVFFRIDRQKVSHVGIYAGADRFIHAPSSGKGVGYARLSRPYWRERLVGGGRF